MRFPNLSFSPFPKLSSPDPNGEGDVEYASFMGRTLAMTLDTVLLLIIFMPIFHTLSEWMSPDYYAMGGDMLVGEITQAMATGQLTVDQGVARMRELGVFEKQSLDYMVQFILTGIIIVFFWVRYHTTPGLFLLRMYIADSRTGGKPSLNQYVNRYFFTVVSVAPFMLGMLWMFFSKRNQGLQDVLAHTVVLHRKVRFGKKLQENTSSGADNEVK